MSPVATETRYQGFDISRHWISVHREPREFPV